MDQEDQFHSFWGEPTQLIDPGMPFYIPDIPKLPFEEQVPSPNFQDITEGFQLSPTLIPMNSAPISTIAFPGYNSNDQEMLDKSSDILYSYRKNPAAQSSLESSLNQINNICFYTNNCQPEPILQSQSNVTNSHKNQIKKSKSNSTLPNDKVPNAQINSSGFSSSQTKAFFENLSKVLDKPLTKEQIAFISNILPRSENQNVPPNNNCNVNFQSKKSSFNANPLNQKQSDSDNRNLKTNNDTDFTLCCKESEFVINPQKLGFIPSNSWMDKDITFGYLVTSFFQKRNNASSRFSHKLYNALRLSSAHPNLTPYIGVEWITPTILKVNKFTFARLLRIKTIDGSLFHQQGNFPSHGFVELTEKEAHELLTPSQLEDVDYEAVRLLKHPAGIFKKDCTGSDIADCKWINSRRRPL